MRGVAPVAGRGSAVRSAFLRFFAERGHQVLPSAPIVPRHDPSLLFVSAGMVPLKQDFLRPDPARPRLASAQKCVRAGGKHNDLDNVGHTARHQTFFEMLGNFSLGDYGKEEAIVHAWTFLTRELGLPAARLTPSVFRDDPEALALWQKVAGVPSSAVLQLGREDNFWSMGETGPCGPCTEIYWRHDDGRADGERLLEIWNVVFMQYNVPAPGAAAVPLARPCVDTGMGLERLTSVLAGAPSNYDTDLLHPLIVALQDLAHRRTGRRPHYAPLAPDASSVALRVAADHVRAAAFLIAEGLFPSPAGRGYVLRRLIRRAAAHTRHLGLAEPCLAALLPALEGCLGDAYPELAERRDAIAAVLRQEEEVFARQERSGRAFLDDELRRAALPPGAAFPPALAVRLWRSHGFPVESSLHEAQRRGLVLDDSHVAALLADLRRASPLAPPPAAPPPDFAPPPTRFVGYERLECEADVTAVAEADADGERLWLALAESPFYAEGGGQVGDAGTLRLPTGETLAVELSVPHTPPTAAPSAALLVRAPDADLRHLIRPGLRLHACVDAAARNATRRHHTATHLLHSALRAELGAGVLQAGSHVSPAGLRFDFVFPEALGPARLAAVEARVAEAVRADTAVETAEMELSAARAAGAMALFSEKYGERVRVVRVPGVGAELCGGTHARRTGELFPFRIVAESSVAAGVRRVEAVAGAAAVAWAAGHERSLRGVAAALQVPLAEAEAAVGRLVARAKSLEAQVGELQRRLLSAAEGGARPAEVERRVAGVPVRLHVVPALSDEAALREKCDALRKSAPHAAHLVLSGATVLCALEPAQLKGSAAEVLRAAVGEMGKGGGKAHLARGTVSDTDAFLKRFHALPS